MEGEYDGALWAGPSCALWLHCPVQSGFSTTTHHVHEDESSVKRSSGLHSRSTVPFPEKECSTHTQWHPPQQLVQTVRNRQGTELSTSRAQTSQSFPCMERSNRLVIHGRVTWQTQCGQSSQSLVKPHSEHVQSYYVSDEPV